MSNSTLLYGQLMSYLRQHSRYCDLRHLKALGWMVSALICRAVEFGSMGTHVPTRAQSPKERRWQRFMSNARIQVEALYLPLVMAALSGATKAGLFGIRHDGPLGSLLYDSPIGRLLRTSGPLWRVLSTIARQLPSASTKDTAKARWLRRHPDVMLLADRGLPIMTWWTGCVWVRGIMRSGCLAMCCCRGKPLSDNDRGTVSPFRRSLPHSWGCGQMALTVAI